MDFYFEQANPNWLLSISLDPISKTPDYKIRAANWISISRRTEKDLD